MFAARPGAQGEWQSLLRIAAMLRGEPDAGKPDFDLAAFDERLLADDLRRLAAGVPDELQAAMLDALGATPGPERCTALLHPADAARHGVQAGDRVRLPVPA